MIISINNSPSPLQLWFKIFSRDTGLNIHFLCKSLGLFPKRQSMSPLTTLKPQCQFLTNTLKTTL